jgi:hypothetical protein
LRDIFKKICLAFLLYRAKNISAAKKRDYSIVIAACLAFARLFLNADPGDPNASYQPSSYMEG